MKRLTTFVGGALGWALGGPIGAVIGAVLGTLFSAEIVGKRKVSSKFKNSETDFHASLLVLASVVIKADGIVDSRELNFVRTQFVKWFGLKRTNDSFKVFSRLVENQPNVLEICNQVQQNMPYQGRLQIIAFLLDLSLSDGVLSQKERKQIVRISGYLGIDRNEFAQLETIKFNKSKSPYDVLGIDQSSTEVEIKKMYRTLVKKYHPDAIVGMGDKVVSEAQNTFRKIQDAYETICKERVIK